jgi:carbamoyl-phosphate synthase large subunit
MNILITSAGQRVSLVQAFQQELKKYKINGFVYTTDMEPSLSAACNVSDRYFKVNKVTSNNYIDELLAICLDYNIKMIIPTIDTELVVLSNNKNQFGNYGINIVISSIEFIQICRNKRKTNIFFQNNNIEIPKPINKNAPTFPLFIKPYDGSLSADTFIVKSQEELLISHVENERFMFMELIDKVEYSEYTVDMYYGKDHKVKSIIPRKRIAVRAGEILKGVTCKNLIVDYLKTRLEYIDGAIGCITLQLFYSSYCDKIIGIEINPRFGGGFPLSYIAGGNYPDWLIKEYLFGENIDYFDNWEDNLLMLRYDDEIIIHGYKN